MTNNQNQRYARASTLPRGSTAPADASRAVSVRSVRSASLGPEATYYQKPAQYAQAMLDKSMRELASKTGTVDSASRRTYCPGLVAPEAPLQARTMYHQTRFRHRPTTVADGRGRAARAPVRERARPGTLSHDVIGVGPNGQVFRPWRLEQSMQPDDIAYALAQQQRLAAGRSCVEAGPYAVRPVTEVAHVSSQPRPAYRHYKYNFLSAGTDALDASEQQQQQQQRDTEQQQRDTAPAWEDPETVYLSSGLGYGTKHRLHYQYLSRDMPPRRTKQAVQAEEYRDKMKQLVAEEEANYY